MGRNPFDRRILAAAEIADIALVAKDRSEERILRDRNSAHVVGRDNDFL